MYVECGKVDKINPQLHHPGPGSWLDKATAALSVGTALAGAEHGDSE